MRKIGFAIFLCLLTVTGLVHKSVGKTSVETSVSINLVANGLTSPLGILSARDGTGRLFIFDQIGTIRILASDGNLLAEPFLDLSDRMVSLNPGYDERGLLGLAFHPDYAENGRFFVYYSAPLRPGAPDGWDHTSRISEFHVFPGQPNRADPDSERILLEIDQPQGNHNAGQILFGPTDGYLYIAVGDGGGANDSGKGHVADWYPVNDGGNGQDITDNLLGSILRIDVDSGMPYAIPPDNPFVDGNGLDEIYAYGFRNPFRMSFDSGGNHELFAGDAGQSRWEEVSIVTAGGNYGWNVKEGTHCFFNLEPQSTCPLTDPNGKPLLDPVIEYPNHNNQDGLGAAVIGGIVYRGNAIGGLWGQYIFGDWSRSHTQGNGILFVGVRRPVEQELWSIQELQIVNRPGGELGEYLLSFGEDENHELYILTTEMSGPSGNTGKVYRLQPGRLLYLPIIRE